MEVLLLLRAERGDRNSGAWVFPGGIVERRDRDWHHCTSGGDALVSAQLGIKEGGLDYQVAALRECFEEAGLLFAADTDGEPLQGDALAALQAWRGPLHRGERTLGEFCAQGRLRLATLLATVYDDVHERMHAVAMRSLLAHLAKLRDEGAACEEEGRWSLPAAGR